MIVYLETKKPGMREGTGVICISLMIIAALQVAT